MENKIPSDALVIGIDFGTTFSGVAVAYSANPEAPDEINVIKTWPGGNNITSDKQHLRLGSQHGRPLRLTESSHGDHSSSTPASTFDFGAFSTAIDATHVVEMKDTGDATRMRWGFQVRPDEQRLRCLKLFLDPRQPIPSYVSLDDIKQQLTASGKNVGTVVAEYLKALFAHTKEILVRRYGELFVASTELQVVLTVPAVWSDAAKDATLKAAEAAGMGSNISMIFEPEASAVYTLQAVQPNHLKVGHNFIVIDAGGGTVDLITYGIKQLTPLRLEEMVPGSGGCCGAVFLNSEQTTFNIPSPGVSDNVSGGIEQGFMYMTSADVGSLFRPIIQDIVGLVEGQMSKVKATRQDVNGLILVGGFGQSECLLKCLRAQFAGGPQEIEVMQPVNAWTAVVRGAVLRGLEGTELILNRKSRRHYGVRCNVPFVPGVHDVSRKYFDPRDESWRAKNEMQWFIAKGDTVSSTEPVLFPFHMLFSPSDSRTVTEELIICDDDGAPSTYSAGQGSATRVMCKMVANLQTVPKHLWRERTNSSGARYSQLSFEMGMQIESGGLRFDFRVDGVVYGKATATFN
ncbi:hypothetical protein LTR85_007411 [Meristemomyces frigidus]|nr:hypothetical protein LTR85_007411 [Meristemomyces frigidus]